MPKLNRIGPFPNVNHMFEKQVQLPTVIALQNHVQFKLVSVMVLRMGLCGMGVCKTDCTAHCDGQIKWETSAHRLLLMHQSLALSTVPVKADRPFMTEGHWNLLVRTVLIWRLSLRSVALQSVLISTNTTGLSRPSASHTDAHGTPFSQV